STARKSERDRAIKQTLQTLDFAARLNAPFVVLHCGSIAMNPITDELIALAQNGGLLSRKYVRKKIDAVRTRERAAPAHLARVKECLKPIVERAAEKNVRLGIEGRRGYEEIPSEREIPQLLDEIAAAHVGYWHDMGHIQIKENLGFLDHVEWLSAIAPRTFGCHMQDVKWPGQDGGGSADRRLAMGGRGNIRVCVGGGFCGVSPANSAARSKNPAQFSTRRRIVFHRYVLQSISARRNRRRYY